MFNPVMSGVKNKGRVSEKIYVYGFEKYGRRTKNLTEIDRNS